MGVLSSIGDAAGGIVASLGGAAVQGAFGLAGQSNAQDFTKEQLQNRHQWEVKDLRAAGLNPILSAHGTPSIGQSPTAKIDAPCTAFGIRVLSSCAAVLQ